MGYESSYDDPDYYMDSRYADALENELISMEAKIIRLERELDEKDDLIQELRSRLEEKEEVPALFATIHFKSPGRPDGYTADDLDEINRRL
jgi:predicted RNase H-like nuclease (RuvC/YqgF family)